MRDIFAVLVIALVVVSLGLFRVPGDTALLDAGIRAEAERAVYQQPHPIGIAVERGVLTATGRVESDGARQELVTMLGGLEGVDRVVDDLTVLPNAEPFRFEAVLGPGGATLSGNVVSAAQEQELAALFGVEEPQLTTATGAPDGEWRGVVALAAAQMAALREGRLRVTGRRVSLEGNVLLPRTRDAIHAALETLPEGYTLDFAVSAIDDGLPYRLQVSRDPSMGLRIAGKVPPDWSSPALDALGMAQEVALKNALLPLEEERFAPAAEAALAVFARLPSGTLTVTDRLVALSGGPVPEEVLAEAEALKELLPTGVALQLALVPEDDDTPLSLEARWDGRDMALSGKVPRDFPSGLGTGVLVHSPYPDLAGWTGRAETLLTALRGMENGIARLEDTGATLSGTAADPDARDRVLTGLGDAEAEIALQDDGTPPGFVLTYGAGRGAGLSGKLPSGLEKAAMSEALGLPLAGAVPTSPNEMAGPVLPALAAIAPLLGEAETVIMTFADGRVDLAVAAAPGCDPEALELALRLRLPEDVTLAVSSATLPGSGDRRVNALRDEPEIFVGGYWLPDLAFSPNALSCGKLADTVPPVLFEPGSFRLAMGSGVPLARLAALARACSRMAGLTLTVTGHSEDASIPALNRQLARRRAEAVKAALVQRGVDAAHVAARAGEDGAGMDYAFD